MRRRELMVILGGVIIAPRALRAQRKAMPVIGFLGLASAEFSATPLTAFRQGLRDPPRILVLCGRRPLAMGRNQHRNPRRPFWLAQCFVPLIMSGAPHRRRCANGAE